MESKEKPPPPPRTYEVLFFKRKNKVHKSKGVSKVDGLLVTNDGFVNLYEGDNTTKHPIHVSKNAEIANAGFHVDDQLSLGQYSVEIVAVVNTGAAAVNKVAAEKQLPTATSALPRKAFSTINRLPTEKKQKTIITTTPTSGWQFNRRPPAQPRTAAVVESSDDRDKTRDVMPQHSPATLPKLPLAPTKNFSTRSTLLSGHKRKLKIPPLPAATTDLHPKSTKLMPFLPGAIGTLTLPQSIRTVMRPHQQSGVVYLWNCLTGASPHLKRIAEQAGLETTPKGAILADSMGMGKTLITIALVFALYRRNKQQRFIIVCPSSLVQNWAKEFDKWLGRASLPKRVVVKKGGQEALQTIRGFTPVKPNQSEVLILSYDIFRMNADILTDAKQIGLLVVDEGHRLKNSSGSITISALNDLDCEARLLITGTPVQNNLSEFHTVANFVCPGILGGLADFRRDFERPITAANRKDATDAQRSLGDKQSQALDYIIKGFLLRRLAKDVLTDLLPPRTVLLLFCRPSSLQCKLYREMTRTISNPLSTLTSLRKLCSHPHLVNPNETNVVDIAASGKLHVLERLLDEIRRTSPQDKVVLVSCFTSVLSMIEANLIKPKCWGYARLDGTTTQNDRQMLVDTFNRTSADKSFIFLLSSKAGGMGLNLVGANRLIMFDADYNPAIDAQAMARIYRPGQTKPTTIYRLFTAGTIEEIVFQRQEQKTNLATMTVDVTSTDDSGRGFTDAELRDCFTLKEDTCCDTKTKMKSLWPEYNGRNSLLAQGCLNPEILTLCDTCPDVLRHVHVCSDDTRSTADDDDDDTSTNLDYRSAYQVENEPPVDSSDEEYEFDG